VIEGQFWDIIEQSRDGIISPSLDEEANDRQLARLTELLEALSPGESSPSTQFCGKYIHSRIIGTSGLSRTSSTAAVPTTGSNISGAGFSRKAAKLFEKNGA
jgi:hypothetical protein